MILVPVVQEKNIKIVVVNKLAKPYKIREKASFFCDFIFVVILDISFVLDTLGT